jgi:hypothetical protein
MYNICETNFPRYDSEIGVFKSRREYKFQINVSIFLDMTPCTPLEVNKSFGIIWTLPAAYFHYASCSAYSSNLKMEETCSSETSVDFQRPTRRYIPEDKTLHYHRCQNFKSCVNSKCINIIYKYIATFDDTVVTNLRILFRHLPGGKNKSHERHINFMIESNSETCMLNISWRVYPLLGNDSVNSCLQ